MKVSVALVCVFALLAAVNASSEDSDEKRHKKTNRRPGVAIKAKETKTSKASSSAKAERETTVVVKRPTKQPKQQQVVIQQASKVHQQVVPQQVIYHQQVPQVHHQVHYSPSHVTHLEVGIPHAHLDVVPMSADGFAIPVDDVDGQLVNYIHVGQGINLVPHVVNGVQQHLLPCVDQLSGHETLVHLGSPNGHLKVVNAVVNGHTIQGIHGYDDLGEVIVPVTYHGHQMVVEPTVHRISTVVHRQPAVATKTITRHYSVPAHTRTYVY